MNENKLTIKDSALSFIVGFLLCQIGVIVATVVALVIFKFFNTDTTDFFVFLNTSIGYLITSTALYMVVIATFFFFNKNKNNQITSRFKISKLFLYILIAVISFLTLYPIIVCVDSLILKMGIEISSIPYPLTTKNYFISLLPLVILPAVCEELLFRGLIFKGLQKRGKNFAIIISSIMFAIFHMSISQTAYPILMGLLLAVIMHYENNIYYCIAIHMTNNFLSLTLSYFKINLLFNHWSYILMAIMLLIAFVSIIIILVKKAKPIETTTPNKTDSMYLVVSLAIMIIIWIGVNFI